MPREYKRALAEQARNATVEAVPARRGRGGGRWRPATAAGGCAWVSRRVHRNPAEEAPDAAGRGAPPGLARGVSAVPDGGPRARRARAAWTAASRSVIRAARSGNLIPDWNDLVYRDRWQAAIDRLHATNNFPEFTGKLCPGAVRRRRACSGINEDPVTIKSIEAVDHRSRLGRRLGDAAGRPPRAPGRRWRSSGSGPAGLAAADQLNRAGHSVTVFEKSDRIGGLLRYGIPEFKMEKRFLDRRLAVLEAEGVVFQAGVNVGVDLPADAPARRLRRRAAGRRRRASRATCPCPAAS